MKRLFLLCLCALGGCDDGGDAIAIDIGVGAVGMTPFTRRFDVAGRGEVRIDLTPPGGLIELSVDCAPPERTDEVGFHFRVSAPGFGVDEQIARAGYWKVRADLPAMATQVRLDAEGGPASCELRVAAVPTACGARELYRSVDVDHDHVAPGTEPRADWEAFPVSGNHYPVWAAWNTFYVAPLRTGYLIHDLEHGGIILSYACKSPSESATCTTSANALSAAKTRFKQTRSNITPDPRQPRRFAARAWRWAYLADCYDEDDLIDFMTRRFRHGREDVDSDPFPPFDPTIGPTM